MKSLQNLEHKVDSLGEDVKQSIERQGELRSEFRGIESKLSIEIDGVRNGLTDEIRGMRSDFSSQIGGVRSEISRIQEQFQELSVFRGTVDTRITSMATWSKWALSVCVVLLLSLAGFAAQSRLDFFALKAEMNDMNRNIKRLTAEDHEGDSAYMSKQRFRMFELTKEILDRHRDHPDRKDGLDLVLAKVLRSSLKDLLHQKRVQKEYILTNKNLISKKRLPLDQLELSFNGPEIEAIPGYDIERIIARPKNDEDVGIDLSNVQIECILSTNENITIQFSLSKDSSKILDDKNLNIPIKLIFVYRKTLEE